MAQAFSMAGFDSYDVNMNSIIQKSFKLDNFQGVVFCGGFSFGDVLGAGSGWANKILHNSALKDEFQKFFSDQTIDNIEKNYLSKINVIKESNEEFEITDFGNKLKSELSLDKGILKRVKNLSNNENDLDNLFNEIRNN